MRKTNNYKKILDTLQELNKSYPQEGIGSHLSIALSDYSDLWSVKDSEILYALQKYQTERELDINPSFPDVSKIELDGAHMFDPPDDDDTYDEDEEF